MRKLSMAVVVALAGAAALAAISLGDEESSRPVALDRSFERLPLHSVDTPSASAAGSVGASARGKPKVKYFETGAFAVPAAGTDVFTSCPSNHKALSGYFLTSAGIPLDLSAIGAESQRDWEFGLLNLTGAPGQAIVGVVCGKNL